MFGCKACSRVRVFNPFLVLFLEEVPVPEPARRHNALCFRNEVLFRNCVCLASSIPLFVFNDVSLPAVWLSSFHSGGMLNQEQEGAALLVFLPSDLCVVWGLVARYAG